jgi:hypothetical protein
MSTATKQARAAHQVAPSTGASKQASMEFLIFEDNGVGSASFEPRAAPRRNKRDAWPRLKEWLDAAGSRIAVDRDRSTSRGCPAASTHGLARRARITRIRRSA